MTDVDDIAADIEAAKAAGRFVQYQPGNGATEILAATSMPSDDEAVAGRAALIGARLHTGAAPTRDPDGYRAGEEPAAPVAVTGPPSTARTSAARLLDEGWSPPGIDGLAQLIRQREALRAAIDDLRAASGAQPGNDDATAVATAVAHADRAGIVAAATAHAVALWLNLETVGNDASRVAGWSLQIETEFWRLVHRHARRIVDSLEGRDSDAAAWMRRFAQSMEAWPTAPKPGRGDYVIRA